MSECVITTTNKPRRNLFRKPLSTLDNMTAQNSVRAYRSTTETVGLQIRCENNYTTVNLTFNEALQLADILKAQVAKYT